MADSPISKISQPLDDTSETIGISTSDVTAPASSDPENPSIEVESPQQSLVTPPNGGYGWVCTVCVAVLNAHTWGMNASYGVFLAHYLSSDLFSGAKYLQYAFIGGLSTSTAMLISPLVTITTRIYGTHFSLAIGIVLHAGGLIGASFAISIWHLFLSQGLAFGVGMGFLFVASVGIPPQWFTTKRSLANGISASGTGFGGLIYALAAGAMIKSIGLGWCLRVLGIVAFGVNTICACLIRDRNKIIGSRQSPLDLKLFRRPEYLLLNGYGFFSMLGVIALVFSLSSYAKFIGLSVSQASVITSILNLGQLLGRPAMGYFSDKIGRINMAILGSFICGLLSLVVWIFAESYGVLIFYALAAGTVTGGFWVSIGPVAVEVVGLQDLPSALNLEWLIIVLPCTFSEPIALKLVDGTGSYLATQLFVGSMYIAAAVCLMFLRGWKVGELAEIAKLKDVNVDGLDPVEVDMGSTNEAARVAGRRTLLKNFWKWRKV